MPRSLDVIVGIAVTLALTCLSFLGTPLAQHPTGSNPDDINFDFSIYYTGNVRGNLEPCG